MAGSEPVARIEPRGRSDEVDFGDALVLWCPGCREEHWPTVRVGPDDPGGARWVWDGDLVKPTLSPSILVTPRQTYDDDGQVVATPRCHSFVRDGQWQFLGDSTHDLSGQTVPVTLEPDRG